MTKNWLEGRRWFQFNIGTLLLLMVAVAVCLGFLCDRAKRLQRTVGALNDLGVVVNYDWEVNANNYPQNPPPPDRLTRMLGPEYFHKPVSVMITDVDQIQAAAPHLRNLAGLKAIWIHAPDFEHVPSNDLILSAWLDSLPTAGLTILTNRGDIMVFR